MNDLDVIERDFLSDDAAKNFAAFIGGSDGREQLDRTVLEGWRGVLRREKPGKPFRVRCGGSSR